MGRGQEILYGDPLVLRSKSLTLKRQGGYLPNGADVVFLKGEGLRIFSFVSGQGQVYSLDKHGRISDERYLPDCQSIKEFFAHREAFIWSNHLNREIRASFAPSFLQTWSFPLLSDNEEEQGLYLTEKKLYAAVSSNGLLSLQEANLSPESVWQATRDAQGDNVENILSWNKREKEALILHRSEERYKLTQLSFSGQKRTWPITSEEIFSSDLPDSLRAFSYVSGRARGEFYYLDDKNHALMRLHADEGLVERIAGLRGSPRALASLGSATLVLYDDQRLDVIDNSGARAPEVLLLEHDFSRLAPLGNGHAVLFSHDRYEIISL